MSQHESNIVHVIHECSAEMCDDSVYASFLTRRGTPYTVFVHTSGRELATMWDDAVCGEEVHKRVGSPGQGAGVLSRQSGIQAKEIVQARS